MLENQRTGSLENLNSFSLLERRSRVETKPLTFSYTIPQVIRRENEVPLLKGNIWKVPDFKKNYETLNKSTRREEREVRFAFT